MSLAANNWQDVRLGTVIALRRVASVRYSDGVTHAAWECRCDCGKVVTLTNRELRRKERFAERGSRVVCSIDCPLHALRTHAAVRA